MARKVLSVSVLVVVLLMLLVMLWSNKDKEFQPKASLKTTAIDSQKTIKLVKNSEIQKANEVIKKPVKLSPDEQYQLEQLMAEVSNPEYSSDPFVEASVQKLKLFGCDLLSQSWLSPEMRLHNSDVWFKKTTQQCEEQKRKRPRLYFQSRLFQMNQNIPANTAWGQKLKASDKLSNRERREFNGEFLRFALRQQQAHWLMLTIILQGERHAFDYETWLNSNNDRYSRAIEEAAVNLLMCEWDDTGLCGPGSMIILVSCVNTPGDCGLDYPEWFEKNHMPGFKKDVALVLAKLKAYAEGDDFE